MQGMKTRIRQFLIRSMRSAYHRLPLKQSTKWRIRELLFRSAPTLFMGAGGASPPAAAAEGGSVDRDRERALERAIRAVASQAPAGRTCSHFIVLPFLATGGAELTALNFGQAVGESLPDAFTLLVIADRGGSADALTMPAFVVPMVLEDALVRNDYASKKVLLEDLIRAIRPAVVHNINSEVGWHLIIERGDSLRKLTRLFGSIFAFQFTDRGDRIGYAAYFLEKSLPHLHGLLSDNRRFIGDAIKFFRIGEDRTKMRTVYNPSRALVPAIEGKARALIDALPARVRAQRRLRVLWAGRLDREKRPELLFELARGCVFADFDVFGQVVVDGGPPMPDLPNLRYRGPFSKPETLFDGGAGPYDAFVFTSRWEGMPNVLLEIGSWGTPIIAPTVGGVGELVSDTTGFPLPEQPAAADYLTALQSIVSAPEEAAARAGRMLELIATRHGWSAFRDSVEAIPGYLRDTPPDMRSDPS